eukprot:g2819.t1
MWARAIRRVCATGERICSGARALHTAVLTHPCFEDHSNGANHPESPARIRRLQAQLRGDCDVVWLDSDDDVPKATRSQLISAGHAEDHVDHMIRTFADATERDMTIAIDGDTAIGPATGDAALRAAGAAIAAVDLVLAEDNLIQNAFCMVRPPGHHAERHRAMGFCFFGNVAAGIAHARDVHRIKRVAVLDFDVHHGNGSQDLLWDDTDALFISIHESPLYPGTGMVEETGVSDNVLNLPVPAGTRGVEIVGLVDSVVVPRLKKWDPEILFISAGFDAHIEDPLGNLSMTTEDYGNITHSVLAATVARAGSSTRGCVSCLEGGYNLDALTDSVISHIDALVES